MSSELVNEIVRTREKITKNTTLYTKGKGAEPNVKGDLIRPLLRNLGWPIDTPQVQEDYTTDSGYPDFVLFTDDEPTFVLEIKALGKDVGSGSESLKQLTDYLIDLDLHFGIVTDGCNWNLCSRSGRRASVEWSINLVKEDADYCAAILSQISIDRLSNLEWEIQTTQQKTELLESHWHSIRNDKEMAIKGLSRMLEALAASFSDEYQITMHDTEYFLRERYRDTAQILAPGKAVRKQHPTVSDTRVRTKGVARRSRQAMPRTIFSDPSAQPTSQKGWKGIIKGRTVPVHGQSPYEMQIGEDPPKSVANWPRVMVETAEWLIRNGHLSKSNCPFPTGPTWYQGSRKKALINSVPNNPDGSRIYNMKSLTNGLYLCTKYNAYQSMNLSWFMIEKSGLDSSILKVKWR